MGGVQLGHGFEARKVDALMAQRRPITGQRLDDLSRAEFTQTTKVHQQAGQAPLQRGYARDHGQRHAEAGLDGAYRCNHMAVAFAQRRVSHPGRSQGRNKGLERRADRSSIDPRQWMPGLLARQCCKCLKRRLPKPMFCHRMHCQKIQQTAGKQNAAATADLDAGQAPLCGEQRRRHTRHAGADHGDVVSLCCCAAHGLPSRATLASSAAWRNSSPNRPQCSASANSAWASCSPHKTGC